MNVHVYLISNAFVINQSQSIRLLLSRIETSFESLLLQITYFNFVRWRFYYKLGLQRTLLNFIAINLICKWNQ